jgi:hypothetical protein
MRIRGLVRCSRARRAAAAAGLGLAFGGVRLLYGPEFTRVGHIFEPPLHPGRGRKLLDRQE